jgi:homoserine dehydrogenase
MFSFGESFENALSDAQSRGYAEKDPTADIEGIDATRKIAILGAIATDRLADVDSIYREGITAIRAKDVANAEKAGYKIKLLGRCMIDGCDTYIMVAPFMIPEDKPLATINGVYNAVEIIGEPIESVMFYGPGAGAGATASAVVGDLMEIMRTGTSYAAPEIKKADHGTSFDSFISRHYVSVSNVCECEINKQFGDVKFINKEGSLDFITSRFSESDIKNRLNALGCNIESRIRILD